jgi:PAS domain S-box-containing protein
VFRWFKTRAIPLRDNNGQVVKWFGSNTDTDDSKRAEGELRATHERLQSFVDANLLGVFMARLNGTVIEANDYFLDLVGHTRAEFDQGELDWLAMTSPESRLSSDAAVREIRERGRASYEKEYMRPDGTRVPVLVADTLLSGPDQLVAGFVLDISVRRAAEAKLAQSEARYSGLLEAAPDAMVVVDGRGEIVLLNVQAEKQFGYSRDELLGQPVTNIIPEGFAERIIADDLRSAADALAQVIGTGIELVALRKDGTEFPIEIMLSPLESAEGILVTAAIRDISARKAVEAEIRGLNTELEQRVLARTIALVAANAELEAFSYSVSHDLRAPLRSIAAFSQILLNEYAAPLDAEGRRIMAIVLRNVKQMGTLIEDLLAFSRVSRASLDRRPVDMARLARGVAEELGAACPGRVIAIDVGPLADVPGDAGLLRQVWANLLGNAVKFTRPVEHATVEVRSERANGEFRFTVRDNGVGFDPAYLDKLFAPFSRLHATADFEGTGIGLAIVARIVARHGGRVWAEGAPGEGALFGFSIPEHLEAA